MDNVSTLLLPALAEGTVLLPTLGVAEIVSATVPRKLFGVPKWVHGFCMWRETEILVLDYHYFLSSTEIHRKKPLMVIKNPLRGSEVFSFLGMLIDGAPQKAELDVHDMNAVEEVNQEGRIWYQFEYFSQKIWVPPEDAIETEVDTLFS